MSPNTSRAKKSCSCRRAGFVAISMRGNLREGIFDSFAALAFLLRLGNVRPRRRGLGGNGAEILLDLGQGLIGLEIADQRQHRVVGSIVAFEERLHVLQGGGVEVLHGADDGVLVGEVVEGSSSTSVSKVLP